MRFKKEAPSVKSEGASFFRIINHHTGLHFVFTIFSNAYLGLTSVLQDPELVISQRNRLLLGIQQFSLLAFENARGMVL